MNVSSLSRNKPIIWETFVASFAKVFDMTKLYILIIFDIKKSFQDLLEIPQQDNGIYSNLRERKFVGNLILFTLLKVFNKRIMIVVT